MRETLKKILFTSSPSGCENMISELIKEELIHLPIEVKTDVMGNTICSINPNGKTKIMIAAHCDEIGYQIISITKDGFLHVHRVGDGDQQAVFGTQLSIITEDNNLVNGVIGKKAPHLETLAEMQKDPTSNNYVVDIGVSTKEEALAIVNIGDYMSIYPNYMELQNDRISSKGLDNKIGVYILLEAIKILSKENLSNLALYGVATTQEEIGYRGAIVAAQSISPEICFVLDVGFASDTPSNSVLDAGEFYLGKGPGINKNADNNPELRKLLLRVASQKNIPVQQITSNKITGGTDTCKIQITNNGVRTALISMPNRYMHSAVEVCDFKDAEYAIQLVVEAIKDLDKTLYEC